MATIIIRKKNTYKAHLINNVSKKEARELAGGAKDDETVAIIDDNGKEALILAKKTYKGWVFSR